MAGRGVSSRTVGYEKPRFARTQAFVQLQSHWYGKLKAEGFRDIETGRDTNNEKAYRDGERVSRILHFMPDEGDVDVEAMMRANAETFGTYTNVSETPTAIAWRAISHAAHELPTEYPHRLFLCDLAQVGCLAGYLLKRHGLTARAAGWAFHRFLADALLGHLRGILVCGPAARHHLAAIVTEEEAAAAAQLLARGTISRAEYSRYLGGA